MGLGVHREGSAVTWACAGGALIREGGRCGGWEGGGGEDCTPPGADTSLPSQAAGCCWDLSSSWLPMPTALKSRYGVQGLEPMVEASSSL